VTRVTRRRAGLALLLLTLLGFSLRLPLLARFPFREDEAIYGYWALHGLYVDPFFLHVWPDKPPIFLWLLQAAFTLWGHAPATAEPAARIVSIVASTLTIPVLAVTARRWWGPTAALVTALLVALNPFALSFAPTAFTDPVLMLAGSLALACAVRGRPFWSGLWLGVAIMTKQQGVFFLPLVLGALALGAPIQLARFLPGRGQRALPPTPNFLAPSRKERTQDYLINSHQSAAGWARAAARFLAGLALVIAPILYWDSLRWTVAPSPWDLGAANAGGVALAALATWLTRAAAWGELTWWLLASPWAWGAYALALTGAAVLAVRRRAPAAHWLPAALLGAWAAGFLLLHILTSVQVWDRYLLPLTIPLTLLGGWAAGELAATASWREVFLEGGLPGGGSSWKCLLAVALLLALALPPAWQASQGQLPIGGDHGDYAGLNEALTAVNQPGALLFHRELGWHARFALFDAVHSGAVQLLYYPSSVYLADAATKSPHKERFVIVPDWSPLPDLPIQLAMRGLQAKEVLRAGHFTVYRIAERPTSDQSWRICALPPAHPHLFTIDAP
jgi:hypothetical protein